VSAASSFESHASGFAAIGTTIENPNIDFAKLARYSMQEAIVEMWPQAGSRPALSDLTDAARVTEMAQAQGVTAPPGATTGELTGLLFEHLCEERLIQPTLIYDYPVEVSPLSKNKPDDPAWVERFEIYAAGMEIANAYSELNDPQEQRRRFEMQVAMRERGDEETHEMDEDYLRALCYAMPPTAGVRRTTIASATPAP